MPTALRNRKKSSRAICQRRRIGDNRRSPQSNDKDVLDAPTLAPGILRRALLPVPSAGPGCRRKRNPRPVPALAGRPRAAQRQGPGRGLCAAPGLLWPRADARAHPLRQAGLLRPPSRLRAAHRRCAADRAGRPGRPLRGALRQAGTPRRTPAQLSGAAPGRARRAGRYLALRRRERRDHPLRRRPAVHPASACNCCVPGGPAPGPSRRCWKSAMASGCGCCRTSPPPGTMPRPSWCCTRPTRSSRAECW